MKKLIYIAVACAAVASFGACKEKKAEKTAAVAAKEYSECLSREDYDAFVDVIVFEPNTPAKQKPEVKKVHSSTLRAIHKPDVDNKGGIKSVAVVSEKVAADGKSANVVVSNTYHNGDFETVAFDMINLDNTWKIKVNDNKEVWKAVDNNGNHEVLKIRAGKDRDFVKTKDDGEKQFVKEITERNGQVEVVKTLENGERHRLVVKDLQEGNRDIEKIITDDEKIVLKDKDEKNKEVLKAKDIEKGEGTDRVKEVIQK